MACEEQMQEMTDKPSDFAEDVVGSSVCGCIGR